MEKLLLLHGAIGSKEQFNEVQKELAADFEVHAINFSGHGGEAIPEEPFGFKLFSATILNWMHAQQIFSINIFGYSMGGYAALYLARHYPDKVKKVATLATKFAWEETTAAKEVKMLNPDKILEKIPSFAEALSKRHTSQNWKQVLNKTAEMMTELGKNPALKNEDLNVIEQPVLVAVGDKDTMVSIEETTSAYRNLKNGQLLVLPDTQHPIEKISVDQLCLAVRSFFKK